MARFARVPSVHLQQYLTGTSQERADFIDVFGSGLKEFGFVIVEGTLIDPTLIRNAYAKVAELFALPLEAKQKLSSPTSGGQRGYTGFGKEHAKNSKIGDLKEFWHVGRETYQGNQKLYADNIWADTEVKDFKLTLHELYQKLDDLAAHLLAATSVYLGLDSQDLPSMARDGNSILRCIHYPALSQEHAKSGAVRAAAHEDINLITILCEATTSGLELLTRQGKWLSVESGPGQMVVDSGDMLSRVCNNQIPSTTHRVINPPGVSNEPRFSMPFFVHPYSACKLEVLPNCRSALVPAKFAPITAGDFLDQRLQEIGLTGKKGKL